MIKDVIEHWMAARGLQRKTWCRAARVNETAIRDILDRDKQPRWDTIEKLAAALGLDVMDFLRPGEQRHVPVKAYVGAGDRVVPFDAGEAIDEVEAIFGLKDAVAVEVRGDSMRPAYRPGDILYYRRDGRTAPRALIGRECVVELTDGSMYVKILRRGRSADRFDLHSHNAEPLEDQEVAWAAPVEFVKRAR